MGQQKCKRRQRGISQEVLPVKKQPAIALARCTEAAIIYNTKFHLLLLTIIATAIYASVINAPFVFDDRGCIVDNPAITNVTFLIDKTSLKTLNLDEDLHKNIILRPVSYASFALNHYLGGLDVRGYHAFNICIHLANAVLVYCLVLLAVKTPYFRLMNKDDHSFTPPLIVAFFSAAFFVCHPLQTQAVTYVTQRFASFATFFYLCSLTLYIRSRLEEKAGIRRIAYAGSIIAAILAMNTKEIAFTLPAVICLFEFMFCSGSIKKRAQLLAPLLLTMLIIPIKVLQLAAELPQGEGSAINRSMNLVNYAGVSNWEYLLSQFRVIISYVRLLVLPFGQNIDHDFPLHASFFTAPVFLSFGILVALLGTAVYLHHLSGKVDSPQRHWLRMNAFGIFWFFATISVESSIIPLDDLMVEQRVYLPSIGFFIATVSATGFIAGRTGLLSNSSRSTYIIALSLLILTLSATSYRRNSLWQNPITLWKDAAQKSPNKSRPYTNLGAHYYELGLLTDALQALNTSLKLNPGNIESRHNIANLYLELKQYAYAEREYLQLIRLQPNNEKIRNNLGHLYYLLQDHEKAVFFYKRALEINPYFLAARINLAELYEAMGEINSAVVEYEAAKRISPKDILVIEKLGQLRENTLKR